jgi:hypothetical protein
MEDSEMNDKSCVGCKFLYSKDTGYSNYTIEETTIYCAKNLNDRLPDDEPWDWRHEPDNWPKTMYGRCNLYAVGVMVRLDVENEDPVENQTDDSEVRAAINAHTR